MLTRYYGVVLGQTTFYLGQHSLEGLKILGKGIFNVHYKSKTFFGEKHLLNMVLSISNDFLGQGQCGERSPTIPYLSVLIVLGTAAEPSVDEYIA